MRWFIQGVLVGVIVSSVAGASDLEDTLAVLTKPSIATLTDVRCIDLRSSSAPEITCYLSFPDTVPIYFYEVNLPKQQVIIKLQNTKIGGMIINGKVDTTVVGPVVSLLTIQEFEDKNATVKLQIPDWYAVTVLTLTLNPMIRNDKDVVFTEIDNAITITLPWPDNNRERSKYYQVDKAPWPKSLIIAALGLGTVGLTAGGYFTYKYITRPESGPELLKPVLPERPSISNTP